MVDVPVLSTDLPCSAGLGAHFSTEGVDLIDDKPLHALDGIFFLETKVERLDSQEMSP